MPYGRDGERRLPNLSAPVVSEMSQQSDVASQPFPHATAPLSVPDASSVYSQPHPYAPFNSLAGSSRLTKTSMPSHYAITAGSEESVVSASVISSSESMALEGSEMELEESRTCGGVFLDPSSMMPPNVDHMLAFLAPVRQLQYMAGPLSQNANDVVAFLAADLDLGSLSEAWTRGLQTPVQSSA